MRFFLPTLSLRAIFDSFSALGLDGNALALECYGKEETVFVQEGVMVSYQELMALWHAAIREDRKPFLAARAGFAAPFGCFGVLDQIVGVSSDVAAGLGAFQQFITLLSATTLVEFDFGTKHVTLNMHNRPCLPIHNIIEEWILATVIQRFRGAFGDAFEISSLFLRGLEKRAPELDEIFGVEVSPNSTYTGFSLPIHVWNKPMPFANPKLYQTLRDLTAKSYLEHFASTPLCYAIWNAFPKLLHTNKSTLEEVAEYLKMSPRTLQRRLQKENFSFRELLDYFRKQEAFRLLSHGSPSMTEIAYQLGYKEQSSFNRSFKRWANTSPRLWIKRTLAATSTS